MLRILGHFQSFTIGYQLIGDAIDYQIEILQQIQRNKIYFSLNGGTYDFLQQQKMTLCFQDDKKTD